MNAKRAELLLKWTEQPILSPSRHHNKFSVLRSNLNCRRWVFKNKNIIVIDDEVGTFESNNRGVTSIGLDAMDASK